MRKAVIFGLIAVFGLAVSDINIAEAKRFGMGSSFGKQRIINKSPQTRPAWPKKQPAMANQRGSTRSSMMGIVGGLALGGLFGAMFFDDTFEGIKALDILIIAAVILLLIYYLGRKHSRKEHSYTNYNEGISPIEPSVGTAPTPEVEPEALQEEFDFHEKEEREPIGSALRPKLDEKHFISAAKEIYLRMQRAWDSGDTEDIRKFCTPEIAERISHDMSPSSNHHTEVATLHAEIADSWIESDMEWVAVSYRGMLREQMTDHTRGAVEDQMAEVNEVWIFQHTPDADDPTWYLAGIQQAH